MGLCLGTNRKMANSLQLENRIAKELECPICLGQIQKPKMLPCQHSFCLDPCLRTLVEDIPNGGKLKCPICQKKFRCFGGVDAFPDNLLMKSLLETKFAPSAPTDEDEPVIEIGEPIVLRNRNVPWIPIVRDHFLGPLLDSFQERELMKNS